MLLKVTEFCAWENEKWSYIIDMDKQEASAINYLMIFIRKANEYFQVAKDAADKQPPPILFHAIFNPYPISPFAASKYNFEFYDSMEQKSGKIKLIKCDGSLSMSDGSGYNHYTNVMIDRKISVAKMKSAMLAMRDKNENKLYKVFDSIFLAESKSKINMGS